MAGCIRSGRTRAAINLSVRRVGGHLVRGEVANLHCFRQSVLKRIMQLYLHLGDVAFIRSMRTSPLDWRIELQEGLPDEGFLLLLWKIHLAQSKLFKLPQQRLWRDVLADTALKVEVLLPNWEEALLP